MKENALKILGGVANVLERSDKNEVQETISSELEALEQDPKFKKVKEYWDVLDENEKMKLYNLWEGITVVWSSRLVTELAKPIDILHLKKASKEKKYKMASPLLRIGVHFWLLDAPKQLSEEKLLKNIKKDAKDLKRNLWIFEKVCRFVPQLKAAQWFVSVARKYAKLYKNDVVPLMQERIREKNAEKAREAIANNSAQAEEDIAHTLAQSQEAMLETWLDEKKAA